MHWPHLSTATRTSVGRAARRFRPTARLLTEYRVATLLRDPRQAELRLCHALARPSTCALDVGASVGNYALAMRKAVGRSGRVVALEPSPAVYAELRQSTWLTGIETIQAAASDRAGTASLYVPRDHQGRHHHPLGSLAHEDAGHERVEVRALRLDDLELDRPVSLVKIDVEGHEAAVIDGAASLIGRDRPALVVEIEQRHLRASSVADVVEPLLKQGYVCAGVRGTTLLPWREFSVEAHQSRFVVSDTELAPGSGDQYVNNFVFWPSGTPAPTLGHGAR